MNARLRSLLASTALTMAVGPALATMGCSRRAEPAAATVESEVPRRFVGGVTENPETVAAEARPVRNDVAQPGREIVTLRYFRIRKGAYDDFYKASVEGVWPYFEKIGARVIGQWVVTHPEGTDGRPEAAGADYDEVYMLTRYASLEHWRATRDMAALGGNGPDWEKCRDALAFRRELTLESWVLFLEGNMAPGGPYFMPGLAERYRRVE